MPAPGATKHAADGAAPGRPRRSAAPRWRRRRALVLAALATLAAAGCGPGGRSYSPSVPPVILISLDTVRADAVGAPGPGGGSLTPHLDRFAADAVSFTDAVTPMPFTLPAHMTLLTGLEPLVHGVTQPDQRLPPQLPTLTTLLATHGYAADGWVTNEWLDADFGFGRGFDRYRRLRHDLTYGDRVSDAGLRSLRRASRPLFLFLHYMDAHSDFESVGGNRLPYWAPPELRPASVDESAYCDPQERCATSWLVAADREGRAVPAATLAELQRLYEAGIHQLDRDLGRLFDGLREIGAYRRALIVVTSDHGEEFREHGKFLHAQPYEECVRVPLMIKLPGNRMAGTESAVPATLADVLPTLLAILDLPAPPHLSGRGLLPLRGDGTGPSDPGALLQDKLRRSRWALRFDGHKLIHDSKDGSVELYDLRRDPGERDDLAAAEPERVEALRRRLEERLDEERHLARRTAASAPSPRPREPAQGEVLDEEERDRLRALGYL